MMLARAFAIVVVACLLVFAGNADAQPPPGAVVEQASLARIGGGTAKLLGDGTVGVIFFFEPGQEHSKDALEMMAQCEKELAQKPVHWAAVVSESVSAEAVTAAVKASGLAMPVLVDKGDQVYAKLKVILHPLVVITDKQNRVAGYEPYQRVNYCNVVRAQLLHALGELNDAGLEAALHPPPSTQGGDGAVAQRELRMGQRHMEAKRYPQAAAAANKALAADAKLVDAHVLLGQALAAQGDCKGAQGAFDKALALDKNSAAAAEGKKACAK